MEKYKILSFSLSLFLCLACSNPSSPNNHADTAAHDNMSIEERLAPTGEIGGHAFVDLGLIALWSTQNMGADNPEEYGDYYAWGELRPKYEYKFNNSRTYGKVMDDITTDPDYDVARKEWSYSWMLPSKEDVEELLENCEIEPFTYHKTEGWIVISKINGKAIFIPAAGYRDSSGVQFEDEIAHLWTGTSDTKGIKQAYNLRLKGTKYKGEWTERFLGFPIRPVAVYFNDFDE